MAVEDLWKTLPEYSVEHTYVAFMAAVKTLYPAVSEDRRYTVGDLDRLTGERARIGIHNLTDLTSYYYHPPDTAYDVQKVYEAAAFALYGTATNSANSSTSTSLVTDVAPTVSSVKSEELAALVGIITKLIGQVLGPALTTLTQNTPATGAVLVAYRPPRTDTCHYCGKQNCSIRKVVLPAGAMVPRYIIGAMMRERIQEWHRQNLNQHAAGILSVQDGMLFEIEHRPSADRAAYILNADERIEYLYREIQALDGARKRPVFNGVHVPPRPRHADIENQSQGSQPTGLPEVGEQQPSATTSEPTVNRSSLSPATSTLCDPPLHPFNRAKDIVRPRQAAPKTIRLDPVPEAEAKKRELAYKTQAPVYNPQLTEDIFKHSLTSTCVSLPPEELLAISPDFSVTIKEIEDEEAPILVLEEQVSLMTAPSDGYVGLNPYDTYLKSLGPKEAPEPLVVAKELHAIRSIIAVIAHVEQVECIIDPGVRSSPSRRWYATRSRPSDPTLDAVGEPVHRYVSGSCPECSLSTW
ncbi:hypothetical protein NEOLEDRAFT_1182077 [Neolentinus lepideus HHB14362 ss-1]|uniref:Uncharacterized protein n=1 Tax=Neolentinus lepideus HHB14362 ss-1 TaxID=1314782 RepID=A0A165PGH5_9AGAM|nr:hypothetical protein NEOLEDRAFT_1182077 [Neolentinus lepideus HHB14362 ss-1]